MSDSDGLAIGLGVDAQVLRIEPGSSSVSSLGGTYVVTGAAVGLKVNRILSAEAGSYAITGTAATVRAGKVLQAAGGSYALSGTDVTLTLFPWDDFTNIEARYNFSTVRQLRQANALQFFGQNFAQADVAAATALPITMVCWAKHGDRAGTLMWLGDKDVGNEFISLEIGAGINSGFAQSFSAAGGIDTANGTKSTVDSQWHFYGGVWASSTSRKIYIDDESPIENTQTNGPGVTYDRTALGMSRDVTPSLGFAGEIDNSMIFSVALTDAQIAWLYNSGSGRSHTDLVESTDADNPGTANLVGSWSMKAAAGVLTDDSTAALDLTVGFTDTIATFARANEEYLTASVVPATGSPVTFAVWWKPASGGTFQGLMALSSSASNVIHIDQTGGNKIWARSDNGTVNANSLTAGTVNLTQWNFVAGVFENANRIAYLNGTAATADTTSVVPSANFTDTWIGAHNPSVQSNWADGSMSICMLWTSALTTAQLDWLYNSGNGRSVWELANSLDADNPGMPASLWDFEDEVTGNVAVDDPGSVNLNDNNTVVRATTGGFERPAVVTAGTVDDDAVLGAAVSRAIDQKNTNDLIQITEASKPLIVTATGGAGGVGVEFDGIDDFLQTAAFAAALTQPITILMIATVADNSADQGLVDGIAPTSEQSIQVNSTGDLIRVDAGTPASSSIGIDYGVLHAIVVVFDGASTTVYRDGGVGEVESAGTETMTGLTVGALQDGATEPANMVIRELVVNDGELTIGEINQIGNYWAGIYSITWTDIV